MRKERYPQRNRWWPPGRTELGGDEILRAVGNRGQSRRQFVGTLAGLTAVGLGMGTATGASQEDTTYVISQNGGAAELTPISGDVPIEERYDWRQTNYSSNGTIDLQRPNTSILFLYEGPAGDVSLVLVHGKLGGDGDGGSASFAFENPPDGGAWRVRDDDYDGPSNYDQWDTEGDVHRIDWTWAGSRTDGGVYGPLGDTFRTRIVPAFNGEATLDGTYYDGTISNWQALSGGSEVTRYGLELDSPIELVAGQTSGDVPQGEDSGDDPDDSSRSTRGNERGPSDEGRGRGPPEDRPGRGPPDEDEIPGRGPPDRDEIPGRGPPDDDAFEDQPSAEEIEDEVEDDIEEIRERVRERIEAARERAEDED